MTEAKVLPNLIDIQVQRVRNSVVGSEPDFGDVYLGETLVAAISVTNTSELYLKDVSLKVEIQTTSHRLRLVKTDTGFFSMDELGPRDRFANSIYHEITEIGTQILICELSCLPPNGERADFSKYVKFYVQKPLDVKTKFYSAESDEIYLEAQVQNVTAGPITFLKVDFDPSPLFSVSSLNSVQESSKEISVFHPITTLHPLGIRQYLYCLKPEGEGKVMRGVASIGKLDVEWLTSYGDKGRLQTSQLQRMAQGFGDKRLTIEELPNPVKLHSAFEIVFRVTNTCERVMHLVLTLEDSSAPGLSWIGSSGKTFSDLEPGKFVEFGLGVLANQPGLQTISGVRLTDKFLKRNYDYDDIGQVIVMV